MWVSGLIIVLIAGAFTPSDDKSQQEVASNESKASAAADPVATTSPLPQPAADGTPETTSRPTATPTSPGPAPSEPPPATAPDATTTTGAPTTTLPPTTTTTTLPPFKVEVSGRGDDVVEVDIPSDDPVIATITYSGRSNFVVWSHTAAAKRLDLLVNVIGAYQGVRPMQLGDGVGGGAVGILEITATGNWEVTIEPLFTARLVLCSEGSAVGEGDDVVVVFDFIDSGGAATLTHNGDRNFAVWAWGRTRDLLVNEIGAYDGTVLVESGLFIWDVSADGAWTVTC